MYQRLGRRPRGYLHRRNAIPRRSTSSERSRCSTLREKYSLPSLQEDSHLSWQATHTSTPRSRREEFPVSPAA
ncbi:hypothetical protein DPMN_014416 [Dreissena polymorpha]|uniref:Uncharacterized protein n=1 Tax=Dreissena polymorpha TaxID=45954 RepID=A0A9D4S4N1_DREPO|nr:hypothetical protein DPMN_014416 [Dreissena polymorpha]